MKKKEKEIDFRAVFKNKKIPILTLDEKWHELFPDYDKPPHIKSLETKVNSLLKNQGKQVNDIKDMKRLKKKLMDEILANMDASSGSDSKMKTKKLEKSQQLIREINDKLAASSDTLSNLPYEIKEANEELMIESMKVCYERLHSGIEKIETLNESIIKLREELKQKILIKQDMEIKNDKMYSYMHNLLGAEVMEIFDKKDNEENEEYD